MGMACIKHMSMNVWCWHVCIYTFGWERPMLWFMSLWPTHKQTFAPLLLVATHYQALLHAGLVKNCAVGTPHLCYLHAKKHMERWFVARQNYKALWDFETELIVCIEIKLISPDLKKNVYWKYVTPLLQTNYSSPQHVEGHFTLKQWRYIILTWLIITYKTESLNQPCYWLQIDRVSTPLAGGISLNLCEPLL